MSRLPRVLLCLLLPLACLQGLPSALAAGPGPAGTVALGDRWTINMKDTDIRDFIGAISSITGDNLIIDPRVTGEVNVVSQEPLDREGVDQLFRSVMASHGFAVLSQEGHTRIMPFGEARTQAPGDGRLQTRVLRAQRVPVAELLPVLQPLVPATGYISAMPSANALLISDSAGNIRRVEDALRELDAPGQFDYTVYPMQNAWAEDTARLIERALGTEPGASGRVVADARGNRLLLFGSPSRRAWLLDLARTMDVPATRSASTRVLRLRHADARELAATLGEISQTLGGEGGGGAARAEPMLVRADPSLNALVIHAAPDTADILAGIVEQLDVPRSQVLVEAAIVEMSGDIDDALGIQWAIDGSRETGVGGVNFNDAGLSIGTLMGALATGQVPESLPSGAILGLGNGSFGALVTALSSSSNSNLLSTPTLLTLDHQPAEILVGQNVPFQTGSYSTPGDGSSNPFTTIERKDIGVTLRVTPHINAGGTLRLEIEQEISALTPSPGNIAVADVITSKRSIKSTVLANDGQVIVLGGLIQDDVIHSESKVPLLGDIPVVGRLFSSTRDSRVKRNLMVFLRPSVITDPAAMVDLSDRKYRQLRPAGDENAEPRGRRLPSAPEHLFDGSVTPATVPAPES